MPSCSPAKLAKLAKAAKKLYVPNDRVGLTDEELLERKLSELRAYANDPVGFVEKEVGEILTPPQVEIAERLLTERIVAVPASHGVGKSHVASRLVAWAVFCRQQLAITTAPTRRQVEQILWSEIRKLLTKVDFPGEKGRTFLRLTERARAFGFTASTSGSAGDSAFQGIHSPDGVFIVIDEANGIHPNVLDGAFSCLSGEKDRILLIGNPTISGTPFEEICEQYRPTRIPAWSHPNVADKYEQHSDGIHRLKPEYANNLPQNYPIPGAITCQWIEQIRATKGENSPYWEGRVEAIFPRINTAALIPASWFDAAIARTIEDTDAPRRWGVDVGDGIDAHAIACFQGNTLTHCLEIASKGDGRDTDRLADLVMSLAKPHERIAVDVTGVGTGVASKLLTCNYAAQRVHFGARAKDNATFANWLTETAWSLREAMRKGEIACDDLGKFQKQLIQEFNATQYVELASGKTAIESKDETKKRLKGRSPNLRDSVILAWGAPRRNAIGQGIVGGDRPIFSEIERF